LFVLAGLQFYRGGDCRYSDDCDRFDSQCLEPGGVLGCGYCVYDHPFQRTSDDDCSGEDVCRRYVVPCQGESCDGDGHCSAVACTTDADCMTHFDCAIAGDASSGICERRICSRDDECNDGFCVERKCYHQLGRCEVIPF